MDSDDKKGKDDKSIDFNKSVVESKLNKVGSLIADANDIAGEIEKLNKVQAHRLGKAQEDIAEAYELLEDD